MKTVTVSDVARFASGQILDQDEEKRIFDAILRQPEFESLYFLLSDEDDVGSEECDGEIESSLHSRNSSKVRELRQQVALLTSARLCLLEGTLATEREDLEVRMPLHWDIHSAPTECRFVPSGTKIGEYRVSVNLPADQQVISLVAADLNWGNSFDFTRVRLHGRWGDRMRVPTDSGGSLQSGHLFGVSLAAASGPPAAPGRVEIREHQGETFAINTDLSPRSARIVAMSKRVLFPLPVLLTALSESGQPIAAEVRVVYQSGQDLENLFEEASERVDWLEVAPLAIEKAAQLSPIQAADLLSSRAYTVRAVAPISGHAGEFILDVSDAEAQKQLRSKAVVLALQIAKLEGQVQA